MSNRSSRRMAKKRPGRPQGMTYADELAHKRRLQDACEAAAKDTMVQLKADVHVQRTLWLACLALNDAFGIGPERFAQFTEALDARSIWYEDLKKGADEAFANEKLRQAAERVSGQHIEYLYEHEFTAAARALAEEKREEEETENA